MASSGTILASLLTISLIAKAQELGNFATVSCPKSQIVAQYGTSTLLECVVSSSKDTKVDVVFWQRVGSKAPELSYIYGEVTSKPGFQFASSFWDEKNLNVSLLISNTSLGHAGEYKCDVVTGGNDGGAKVHLTVKSNYSKPRMHSEPKKISRDQGFSLTCAANGGYPKGDIRWVVDGAAWSQNPDVEVKEDSRGLFDLTSTLSFGPHTEFNKFVCEVYNSKKEKESQQELHNIFTDVNPSTSLGDKNPSVIKIVAPVVVIGSLIVGLLVVLLLCRRKQQARRPSAVPLMNAPPLDVEQCDKMIPLNAPVP